MIEPLSALTLPIAKLLLKSWLGDTGADIGVNLFQLGLSRLGDRARARTAQHRAEEIADAVIADLERFFASEHLAPEKLTAAASALGDTIERHVRAAFLVHQQLNAKAIEQALLAARPVDQIYHSAEPEHGLYIRLVKALAPRLRAVASEVPGYELERDATLLEKMAQVAADTPRILTELESVRRQAAHTETVAEDLATREVGRRAEYEASYRKAVLNALDYVEILGLDIERAKRQAQLSIAYLSLTTSIPHLGRLDYETLLDLMPAFGGRVLIEGAAGSGKSTLLRWTAVQSAKLYEHNSTHLEARLRKFAWESSKIQNIPWTLRTTTEQHGFKELRALLGVIQGQGLRKDADFASIVALSQDLASRDWRKRLPFLIRLRQLAPGLPKPELLPDHLSDALGSPPENWVRDLLIRGDVLLLIDGVDEVPEGAAREAILNSIEEYVRLYDQCAVIVASRPNAFDKSRFSALGFLEAEVDELTSDQRLCFVDSWHRALAASLGRSETDSEIMSFAEKLEVAFDRQPQIARLATNPLLCAGICALHERNPATLPKNEWDLCAKLTEMLVELRDRSQGRQNPIRFEEFGPAYRLSYPDKRSILARIAWAMVSQQLSALPRDEALQQVRSALREIKDTKRLTPKAVLMALEARSGVLRGAGSQGSAPEKASDDGLDSADKSPRDDAVEFAHNTLKSWLASFYCLDQNTPRALASQALVSGYAEVIAFAAAAPGHRQYAQLLIQSLLDGAEKTKDPEARRALLVLAMRCDAVAPNLPRPLRNRLAILPKLLLPPATFDESQQLAVLGDAAVPHLAPRFDMPKGKAAACVRCLRLIGTELARTTLEAWRDTHVVSALEELAEVFSPLTLPRVLAAVQNSRLWDTLPASIRANITDLDLLREQKHLQKLWLDRTNVANLEPLANLTNLEWLFLWSTRVTDLAPLANLSNLQWLSLSMTEVTDLAPLANCRNLQQLDLVSTRVADLVPLANLTNLQRLDLSRTPVANVAPLANLTSLRSLYLHGTQVSQEQMTELKRSLAERGNRSVDIAGP